jgi:hypothetical protein
MASYPSATTIGVIIAPHARPTCCSERGDFAKRLAATGLAKALRDQMRSGGAVPRVNLHPGKVRLSDVTRRALLTLTNPGNQVVRPAAEDVAAATPSNLTQAQPLETPPSVRKQHPEQLNGQNEYVDEDRRRQERWQRWFDLIQPFSDMINGPQRNGTPRH